MPERMTRETEPGRLSVEAEIEEVQKALTHLNQRMGELMTKERLSPAEQKELDLMYNNLMVLEEMMQGKMPEEFTARSS